MAVLSTLREPSLGRHEHRAFLRSAVLDGPPLIPATACHQSNDVETYRRFSAVEYPGAAVEASRAAVG